MTQSSNRPCPNCGTSVAVDQHFCTNCGAPMGSAQPSSQPPSQYYGYGQAQQSMQQPPPINPDLPSYAQLAPEERQQQNPIGDALAALGLLFFLRRSERRRGASGARSGCCALLATLIIIAIVAFVIYTILRAHAGY